jgi:hypothetical protein
VADGQLAAVRREGQAARQTGKRAPQPVGEDFERLRSASSDERLLGVSL